MALSRKGVQDSSQKGTRDEYQLTKKLRRIKVMGKEIRVDHKLGPLKR